MDLCQPFELIESREQYDAFITVKGGDSRVAGAVRLHRSCAHGGESRDSFGSARRHGDARRAEVERKKYGRAQARGALPVLQALADRVMRAKSSAFSRMQGLFAFGVRHSGRC